MTRNYFTTKRFSELDFESFGVTVEATFCVKVGYCYGEFDVKSVDLEIYEIVDLSTPDGDFLEELNDEQYAELEKYLEKYCEDYRSDIISSCDIHKDDFIDNHYDD